MESHQEIDFIATVEGVYTISDLLKKDLKTYDNIKEINNATAIRILNKLAEVSIIKKLEGSGTTHHLAS
jgi:Fe2+ or Zn2+ uptake regulation protein